MTPPGPLLHVPHCRPTCLPRKLPGCSTGPCGGRVIELRFAEVLQEVWAIQDPHRPIGRSIRCPRKLPGRGPIPRTGLSRRACDRQAHGGPGFLDALAGGWTPGSSSGSDTGLLSPSGRSGICGRARAGPPGAGQSRCSHRGHSRGRAASSRVLSVLLCLLSGVLTPSAVLTRLWAAHDAGRRAVTLAVGSWSTPLSRW